MTRTRSRATRSMIALASAAMLLLSACGSGEPGDTSAGGTSATGATGATDATGSTGEDDTTGGYGNAGNDGDDGEGGGGKAAASIQANNFSFDPAELEVEAGSELDVRNGNAGTPHTFTVEGTDVDVELDPLETTTVTIDLEPGSYEFVCRFHAQMTGALAVA